ncbi:MAG TPA: hypothetical protein VMP11_08675 [Verrucomicrobiae bacterium]|nr:hypothetical protein [Verrucomicrobiae bacterium]
MSNLKKSCFYFLQVLAILAVVWAATDALCVRRAKYSDIVDFKAEVLTNGGGIRLSGLVMHSALAVRDIRFSAKADTIDVDLNLVYGKAAPSGSFEFVVFLRPDTRTVRFGTDRFTV